MWRLDGYMPSSKYRKKSRRNLLVNGKQMLEKLGISLRLSFGPCCRSYTVAHTIPIPSLRLVVDI